MSKAFVISACGIVHPGYAEDLGISAESAQKIASGAGQGGSAIIGPDTRVLAGPLDGRTEGIIYADLDFDQWARQKIAQDFAGHYNRNDVFQLRINRKPPAGYISEDDPTTTEHFTGAASAEAGQDSGEHETLLTDVNWSPKIGPAK
ncbi:hypothetical protein GCM10009589_28110 [Arthrobacter pascens]